MKFKVLQNTPFPGLCKEIADCRNDRSTNLAVLFGRLPDFLVFTRPGEAEMITDQEVWPTDKVLSCRISPDVKFEDAFNLIRFHLNSADLYPHPCDS